MSVTLIFNNQTNILGYITRAKHSIDKNSRRSDESHLSVKPEKKSYLCPLNTLQSHRSYCDWSLYVATIHRLHYSGRETFFFFLNSVYDSDTIVALKQGQGHQTWYKLVDPTHSINHKKTTLKLLSNQKTSFTSLWIYAEEKSIGVFILCLICLTILQRFNLIGWDHKIFC